MSWIVWTALILVAAVLELIAVFNRKPGDSFTDFIRGLLKHGFGVALVPAYIWTGWHWFVESELLCKTVWDDIAIIGVVGVAMMLRPGSKRE